MMEELLDAIDALPDYGVILNIYPISGKEDVGMPAPLKTMIQVADLKVLARNYRQVSGIGKFGRMEDK